MEVKEFLRALIGDEIEVEESADSTTAETQETSVEEEGAKEAESSNESESDKLRKVIRDELKGMLSEIAEQEAERTKRARAQSVAKVPEKQPERTVDDIMAERFKTSMGIKEKKEGN